MSHRLDCGCVYCTTPVLTRAIDDGPRLQPRPWQHEVWDALGDAPPGWHGGLEVTDKPKPYYHGCEHKHTTEYATGKFCRDCGRWLV